MVSILGSIGVLINLTKSTMAEKYLEMTFTWMTRFGVAIIFEGLYLANGMFPTLFASTSFGICNFFAGIAGLLTYEFILKLQDQDQFLVILNLSIASAIACLFIYEEE